MNGGVLRHPHDVGIKSVRAHFFCRQNLHDVSPWQVGQVCL
jgi:hypothetical protein